MRRRIRGENLGGGIACTKAAYTSLGSCKSMQPTVFSTGGFILVSDYVRMEVTLIGASWDVVAGVQAGCGLHSYEALWSTELPCARGVKPGALSGGGAGGTLGSPTASAWFPVQVWRVFRRTSCTPHFSVGVSRITHFIFCILYYPSQCHTMFALGSA